MKNQILKMVFNNMGAEAISFIIINDKEMKVITFQLSEDDDFINIMGGDVTSQATLDSYVMKNNDDGNMIEMLEIAKERAVSCEEVSQKALEYSVKELSEKQLKYILS